MTPRALPSSAPEASWGHALLASPLRSAPAQRSNRAGPCGGRPRREEYPWSVPAAMRRLYELINAGDIDGFGDQLAESLFHRARGDAGPGAEQGGGQAALPHVPGVVPGPAHGNVAEILPSGDKVVARIRATGTHTGEAFMGVPASGKSVDVQLIDITRFDDDGLAREHSESLRRAQPDKAAAGCDSGDGAAHIERRSNLQGPHPRSVRSRLTVSSWTEVRSSGRTSLERTRRGCMAHRLLKRAMPRDAPLAIGLTPLPADSRAVGPPIRRRCDKAARILRECGTSCPGCDRSPACLRSHRDLAAGARQRLLAPRLELRSRALNCVVHVVTPSRRGCARS